MKVEIFERYLSKLVELEMRCNKLSEFDNGEICIWYFKAKARQISGLVDFLKNAGDHFSGMTIKVIKSLEVSSVKYTVEISESKEEAGQTLIDFISIITNPEGYFNQLETTIIKAEEEVQKP